MMWCASGFCGTCRFSSLKPRFSPPRPSNQGFQTTARLIKTSPQAAFNNNGWSWANRAPEIFALWEMCCACFKVWWKSETSGQLARRIYVMSNWLSPNLKPTSPGSIKLVHVFHIFTFLGVHLEQPTSPTHVSPTSLHPSCLAPAPQLMLR